MCRRFFLAVWLLGLSGLPLYSFDDGSSRAKRPLDLPSGGKSSDEDKQDEDSPEVIHFYGYGYEGNGFFWCLDYSGSMSGGQLDRLKQEMTRAISSLSSRAVFKTRLEGCCSNRGRFSSIGNHG